MTRVKFSFLFILASLFVACADDDSGAVNNFDRKAMLSDIGNNVIIPAFEDLNREVVLLKSLVTEFAISPSELALTNTQAKFVEAYTQWQHCNFYDFGPSFTHIIRTSSNSFPTDILTIEENINSQDYDLKSATNLVASGFPALDYLLFGINENPVEFYAENENARNYLNDVTTELYNEINKVSTDWSNTYIETFTNADGTDVGSSLGQMINQLTHHVEAYLRDGKIGIPLGVRNLNEPLPMHTEAAYKGDISLQLCKENLIALKAIFEGNAGMGLNDYLDALNAQHIEESLGNAIITIIDKAIDKVNAIPVPLKEAVISSPVEVGETYAALQQLTVILKNDLTSSLGVLITYQDNDGD